MAGNNNAAGVKIIIFFGKNGKTLFLSVSLPSGEQQIKQQNSFTRVFVIKHTDSLSDSSFNLFRGVHTASVPEYMISQTDTVRAPA